MIYVLFGASPRIWNRLKGVHQGTTVLKKIIDKIKAQVPVSVLPRNEHEGESECRTHACLIHTY